MESKKKFAWVYFSQDVTNGTEVQCQNCMKDFIVSKDVGWYNKNKIHCPNCKIETRYPPGESW